jgi:hypothetical protein
MSRLTRFIVRSLFAISLALLCAIAPLAQIVPNEFVQAQVPVVTLILLCYLGKLLIDTLFYDHFRP